MANEATSAADVAFAFGTPAISSWSLQCRTARAKEINSAEFVPCDGASGTALSVTPFTSTQSALATNDGAQPQLAVDLLGTAIREPFFEVVEPSDWTLDFGETGRAGVRMFLDELGRAGLAPACGAVDFVAPAAG